MKKQILDALKAKFPGVSESILGRIADKLAKTVITEDQVATSIEGVSTQSIMESYADFRATEATQSAVKNYEDRHGLKDGQKVQGGEPVKKIEPDKDTQPTGGGSDLSAQITAAVTAAMKPLQDEISTLKAGKVSENRKQQLETIIAKLPENLRKPYSRLQVELLSNEEFSALVAEVSPEVDALAAQASAKRVVFGIPTKGANGSFNEPGKQELDSAASALGI